MMQKLKVWIKEEKCFADCIETIRYHAKEIVLSWGGICESDCFDFEDVIFTQSTGLKDLNGVEIFEGDIVRFFDSLYTVFYDIKEGCYRLKPHDDRWVVDYMCNFSSEESFEVVSNIYENKEYL